MGVPEALLDRVGILVRVGVPVTRTQRVSTGEPTSIFEKACVELLLPVVGSVVVAPLQARHLEAAGGEEQEGVLELL